MRFAPHVLLLILLEELLHACGIGLGWLPHLARAFFEEEQTLIVFLHEVLQAGILGTEALGLLVQNLFHSLLGT